MIIYTVPFSLLYLTICVLSRLTYSITHDVCTVTYCKSKASQSDAICIGQTLAVRTAYNDN